MLIRIEGLDEKSAYLSEALQNRGHHVIGEGNADLIILAIPRSSFPLNELAYLPSGQKILCGLTSPEFDQLADEKGWQLFRPLTDSIYIHENAILSAEGALYYAMRSSPLALRDTHCLVTGYGRIGKALTDGLRTLGAQVTVAARRGESRLAAGESSIDFPVLPAILPSVDILFNTVPAPLLGKDLLSLVSRDALLIELASPPYGIDLFCAMEMGLRAWGEWGIPGRYCPRSASRLLMNYLERKLSI